MVKAVVSKPSEQKTYDLVTKNLVLKSSDGYQYFIDPYCGKTYGGVKVSKSFSACSILYCVTKIGDWGDKKYILTTVCRLFLIKL